MGGHGGLNILPQKRWNVYNRDNRLKVSQDEAKAKAKEDEEEARALQAEREFRHQQLLTRAGMGPATASGAANSSQTALQGVTQQEGQLAVQAEGSGKLEHINFWKEEEIKLKEQHPEVKAAKLDEARKRGDVNLYTSDPKFDERFQLGYQMKGEQPWWSKVNKGPEPMTTLPDPLLSRITAASSHPISHTSAHQVLLPPAPAAAAHRLEGPDGRGKRKRRQRDSPSEESSEDEKVAAARQFLRQTLGAEQLQGLTHAGSDSSSESGSDTDSDSSDDSDSNSSSTSSDSGEDRRRRRHASKKRQEKDSRHTRSLSRGETRRSKRRKSSSGKEPKKDHKRDKRKREKHRKERRREGRSERDKGSSKRRSSSRRDGQAAVAAGGAPAVKSLEQLRAERLEREQGERGRAKLVMIGALEGPDASKEPAGYNQAFGFAANIKKKH